MARAKNALTYAPVSVPTETRVAASNEATVVRELQRDVTVMAPRKEGFNGISPISVGGSKRAGFTNVILDNSAGTESKQYIIGDPKGLIKNAGRLTRAIDPTGGSVLPAVFKQMTEMGYAIDTINYKASLSPDQFNQPFDIVKADVNGKFTLDPVDIAGAERPNNFNPNLLILDLDGDVLLNTFEALLIEVDEGEKVSLNIKFRAVGS